MGRKVCRLKPPPNSYFDNEGILQRKLAPFITELSTYLAQGSEKLKAEIQQELEVSQQMSYSL